MSDNSGAKYIIAHFYFSCELCSELEKFYILLNPNTVGAVFKSADSIDLNPYLLRIYYSADSIAHFHKKEGHRGPSGLT